MSHPQIADGISPAIAEVLHELFNSGDSQSYAVADCLNDIASNEAEQATDEHLVCCAEEIIASAERVIHAVHPRVVGAPVTTTVEVPTDKLATLLDAALAAANMVDADRFAGRRVSAELKTMSLRLLISEFRTKLGVKGDDEQRGLLPAAKETGSDGTDHSDQRGDGDREGSDGDHQQHGLDSGAGDRGDAPLV